MYEFATVVKFPLFDTNFVCFVAERHQRLTGAALTRKPAPSGCTFVVVRRLAITEIRTRTGSALPPIVDERAAAGVCSAMAECASMVTTIIENYSHV